jgi:arylformamidase
VTKTDRRRAGLWGGDGWIDVSRPLGPDTPVWPGDRRVSLDAVSIDDLTVSSVTMTCHAGTHVDAPTHLVAAGVAVHEIPIGRFIGPAEVVRLPVGCRLARPGDLPVGWTPRTAKVLLRSDSHPRHARFEDGFAAVTAELVGWLADHGVETLGIDTPSVDEYESRELEAHRALVDRGMTWIESLDLHGVEAGVYLMVALPLPLRGTEAAPLRALLKKLPEEELPPRS